MTKELLLARIAKLNKLRLVFLLVGILLLLGGFTLTIVYSVTDSINTMNSAESGEYVDFYQKLIDQFSDPKYMLFITIAGLMIDGGIVLLILRGALLGRKLNKAYQELRELNNRENIDDDGIDRSMWR